MTQFGKKINKMLKDKIERKKNKENDKKNNDQENVYYI